MNSKCIGPVLPPGLRRPASSDDDDDDERAETSSEARGSNEPTIGPALPPHLMKRLRRSSEDEASTSNRAAKGSTTIGPALPPHLKHRAAAGGDGGTTPPSSESDSSGEDGQIGPSIGLKGGEYDMREEFADRERRGKASKDVVLERESWMTELPSDRTGVKIGTGARMFTKRDGKDIVLDDSWTAAPGKEVTRTKDDRKAAQHQQELAQRKRDAEIDEHLAEFNAAKRSKPLIEMHKEKKSKKKDKKDKKSKHKDKKHKKDRKKEKREKKDKSDDDPSAGPGNDEANRLLPPQIRKPFNWEEDMKVSMVDTSRAKSMLDKTLLQSRFAPSKSQKYL
ncbi:GPALPP motifs-containing protein 1 [Galendromus occidentalis]|uniref:GPALPP motifs-containing protein 1 n=1 Tax=Galendromus occidentalis TaxID=34638 RepID=A0AAJ6VYW6_9ACAR|nr:GPALPP motifs-containing protein 1 [Galendromus occidentalis]